MSRTKLLLDLADSIRAVADNLETIVKTLADDDPLPDSGTAPPPAAASSITPEPASQSQAESAPTLDLPTLRAFTADRAKTKEQKAQVKALLAMHGVNRLPELPEAEYAAFKKEVEAIA